MRNLRSVAIAAIAAALLAGCGVSSAPTVTFPAGSIGPAATVGPAVAQVRAVLAAALAAQNLVLTDVLVPYRPVEAAELVGAPRTTVQVPLPADPTGGYITIYEFLDSATAATAAKGQADYLASGPGRVQYPPGSVLVIRQVGSTVLFYRWAPSAAPDPGTPGIQKALETLGVGFPVPG